MFQSVVEEAVEFILSSIGTVNKETIYRHLENNYGLRREDIPERIEEFAGAMEQTFGNVAKLLEIKIIERIHCKYRDFKYTPEKEELSFSGYVLNFKKFIER